MTKADSYHTVDGWFFPAAILVQGQQQITDTTGGRCLTLALLLDAPVSETQKPNPVESLFTDLTLRTQWERAVKQKGFVASAVLCSEHFKADDFDRTGQTVRLRHGVKPSVFSFSPNLQKQVQPRTTRNSRKTEESLAVDPPKPLREAKPQSNVMLIPEAPTVGLMDKIKTDHSYALPASPAALKARLNAALARVESLEHARRNCMIRERRAKKNLDALLEELRETNLINEELRQRLEGDSGGWINNDPSADQPQGIFRHLMVRCGVSLSGHGNMAQQNGSMSSSAVELSSAANAGDLDPPFSSTLWWSCFGSEKAILLRFVCASLVKDRSHLMGVCAGK
ncbi:uncharacterized protein ACB057_015596 [Neosynchiropus ocellatus]